MRCLQRGGQRRTECRGRKGQLRADAARTDGDRVEVDLAPPRGVWGTARVSPVRFKGPEGPRHA